MAKDIDCSACEELRENAPNFVQNGITDTECNSLKNDTGFNPNLTTLHTDCEDLDTANDCLIGMMDGEIEKYEPCDWQEYMHKFVPNLYQLLKAFVCTICGIWTNIHNLWDTINDMKDEDSRIDCIIDSLSKGHDFAVGETPSDDGYLVAGKGVTFLTRGSGDIFNANATLTYVGGGLCIFSGSLMFYTSNFTDNGTCYNFDNGSVVRQSSARLGNSVWGESMYNTTQGNELILEARINLANHPEIDQFFTGFGEFTDTGAAQLYVGVYKAGTYAFGQHGHCDPSTGVPVGSGSDSGHLVPAGWVYIQIRASYIISLVTSGQTNAQASPKTFLGVRFNVDKLDC